MSDASAIDPGTVLGEPKGTVGVTRKVNLGNFESEEISVFVQFPVTYGDEDATALAASDAAFLAKSSVYSQLGLPVELQDGVLRVTSAFPGAAVVQDAAPVAAPPTQAIPVQSAPTAAPSASAAPSAASAPEGASPAAAGSPSCPVCGGGMYDNRAKNAERAAEGKKALPEARCRNHADPPKGTSCSGILWSIDKGK